MVPAHKLVAAVCLAIKGLKEPKGTTIKAITSYIRSLLNYKPVATVNVKKAVKTALDRQYLKETKDGKYILNVSGIDFNLMDKPSVGNIINESKCAPRRTRTKSIKMRRKRTRSRKSTYRRQARRRTRSRLLRKRTTSRRSICVVRRRMRSRSSRRKSGCAGRRHGRRSSHRRSSHRRSSHRSRSHSRSRSRSRGSSCRSRSRHRSHRRCFKSRSRSRSYSPCRRHHSRRHSRRGHSKRKVIRCPPMTTRRIYKRKRYAKRGRRKR